MRRLLIGLGVLSVVLLTWTALLGVSVMFGMTSSVRFLSVTLAAAVVSIATHVLATLRTWSRR